MQRACVLVSGLWMLLLEVSQMLSYLGYADRAAWTAQEVAQLVVVQRSTWRWTVALREAVLLGVLAHGRFRVLGEKGEQHEGLHASR